MIFYWYNKIHSFNNQCGIINGERIEVDRERSTILPNEKGLYNIIYSQIIDNSKILQQSQSLMEKRSTVFYEHEFQYKKN